MRKETQEDEEEMEERVAETIDMEKEEGKKVMFQKEIEDIGRRRVCYRRRKKSICSRLKRRTRGRKRWGRKLLCRRRRARRKWRRQLRRDQRR